MNPSKFSFDLKQKYWEVFPSVDHRFAIFVLGKANKGSRPRRIEWSRRRASNSRTLFISFHSDASPSKNFSPYHEDVHSRDLHSITSMIWCPPLLHADRKTVVTVKGPPSVITRRGAVYLSPPHFIIISDALGRNLFGVKFFFLMLKLLPSFISINGRI